jgi:predicted DNA-binding transcriptional regulator AlpA
MNNFQLTFVTEPLTEDIEDTILDKTGAVISVVGNLTLVILNWPGSSCEAAGWAAARAIEESGARVLRMYLDLVNKAEIAARCGVSRPTVGEWAAKKGPVTAFPDELTWSTGPLWAWGDVNEWLRRNMPKRCDSNCVPNASEVTHFNAQWDAGEEPELTVVSVAQISTVRRATVSWGSLVAVGGQ